MPAAAKIETFTDAQATDEAVLLLTRKLRRLHPEAYNDLVKRMPALAWDALMAAELRADDLRFADQRAGVSRAYPDRFAGDDLVDEGDDEPA